VIEVLLDPFSYAFFVKGVIVATLAGGLCGLIGVYITLRGMSYIGHGLSHAVFGGFAASSIIGVNYFLGAGVWGLASALAINRVTRNRRIGADAAIGVITTASFALGVALLTAFGNKGPSFDAALFGSIIGVEASDVWVLAAVTAFTVAVLFLNYRSRHGCLPPHRGNPADASCRPTRPRQLRTAACGSAVRKRLRSEHRRHPECRRAGGRHLQRPTQPRQPDRRM
jgi:hypothetical protein